MKYLKLICLLLLASQVACVTNATEGAVQVQVVRGQINRIIIDDGQLADASASQI